MTEQELQTEETPIDEVTQMGDVYDRVMAEDTPPLEGAVLDGERPRDELGRFTAKDGEQPQDTAQEQPAEEAEEPEEQQAQEADSDDADQADDGEETPQVVDAPNYVPQAVREKWAEIPSEAQEAISKSHHDMMTKLANLGRQSQAITPVFNQIQRAAQQFPELANMTPDALAADVFELAHTRANLLRDPVNTLLQVANQTGALEQLAQRLGGQVQPGIQQNEQLQNIQMQQQMAAMQQQLQQAQNPANIDHVVQERLAAHNVEQEVQGFASDKEHWSAVEADIPALIPAVQQLKGEGASNADVLQTAYDMAIDAKGLRASPDPAPQAAPAKPDPRRTKAAIKAKSVNIKSTGGKPAPVSERDAMAAAYDKIMTQ